MIKREVMLSFEDEELEEIYIHLDYEIKGERIEAIMYGPNMRPPEYPELSINNIRGEIDLRSILESEEDVEFKAKLETAIKEGKFSAALGWFEFEGFEFEDKELTVDLKKKEGLLFEITDWRRT